MRRRYVICRPKLWLDGDGDGEAITSPPLTVYEAEAPEVDTGLLDAHGNKIMRDTRKEIGFLLPSDDEPAD